MKYLFLDANIYLHCKDYEQIPWKEIIPTSEDITIVVPPITRAEIDKIKDKGTGKVNKRARNISQRFREVFLDNVQRTIPMILCHAPKSKDYDEYNFDRETQDDQFILSVMLYQKSTGNDVIIVAIDTNPLITAQSNGLESLYLPDEHCLKPELTEEEKQLQKLKKELEQFKSRSSRPQLFFDNQKQITKLKKPILQETDSLIKKNIEEELIEVPFRYDNRSTDNHFPTATFSSLALAMSVFKPSPEEIERYNREAEEYHKEFEEWITLKINRDTIKSLICELKFILVNNGNAQTGNLDVFINFPNHVNLYDDNSKQHFDETTPPIKPAPPSHTTVFMDRNLRKSFQDHQSFGLNLYPIGYVDRRPQIWDLDKSIIKHDYHVTEEPLSQTLYRNVSLDDGIYIDLMQCGNFSIRYSIVDTSLPEPVEGVLNVVIE